MTNAAPITDLDRYLVALNGALAVGLRSRSRILEEAGEHLYEAALAEHQGMAAQIERRETPVAPGETLWTEAQRRAIAAFGSPEEVAAGFQHGRLGAFDRRLAQADVRFERWLGRRPVLAGTVWAATTSLAWVALGAAIIAIGSLFDVGAGRGVNVMLPLAAASVFWFCLRMTSVLRGSAVAGWRGLVLWQPAAFRLVALRDWGGYLFFIGFVMLTDPMSFIELTGAWIGLALAVELAARLGRRTGHGVRWSAYGDDPDENWSRYMSGVFASAIITLSLIVLASSSVGLAAALALLLAGFTATIALVRRLAWNSSVKRNWGRTYAARAAAR